MKVTRWGWLAYGLAAVVIALDQALKAWVLGPLNLAERGTVEVLGPFHMTLVQNEGVSFGLLHADTQVVRWGLCALSVVVAGALAWIARRADKPLSGLCLGLIIGGAVGNVIDRARVGAVTDFLDFQALHFPWVFNIADSGISVGVALLILESFVAPRRKAAA